MKLSRKEVCNLIDIDEKELKTIFTLSGIKSQKRRSMRSWEKLLWICGLGAHI